MRKVEGCGSTSVSGTSLEVADSLFVLSPKHLRLSPSELPINFCIFTFEISLYYTAQAGLEPLGPFASSFQVLEWQAWAATPWLISSNGPWERLSVQPGCSLTDVVSSEQSATEACCVCLPCPGVLKRYGLEAWCLALSVRHLAMKLPFGSLYTEDWT